MCREELKTICDAHKATILCSDLAKCKWKYLNTDGTTKQQQKLDGIVANDVVLDVNELPDGRVDSAIEDVSRECEKLRKITKILSLTNPDSINWILVVSSTSDTASIQKRLNKLIEKRQIDENKFRSANAKTINLIETFCSMNLGANLRTAFLSGTMKFYEVEDLNEQRNHRYISFANYLKEQVFLNMFQGYFL